MQKLLLAVDGSENALRAAQYVARVANACGPIQVHLITVQGEPFLYGEVAVYVDRKTLEQLQREHGETALEPAEKLLAAANVSYTKEVSVGEVASTIAERAQALGCDGIVMGTRGLGTLGGLVMGSVATKVVHLAKQPVTLVK
jgi:nucleotide-binding universal stress UspA family protein